MKEVPHPLLTPLLQCTSKSRRSVFSDMTSWCFGFMQIDGWIAFDMPRREIHHERVFKKIRITPFIYCQKDHDIEKLALMLRNDWNALRLFNYSYLVQTVLLCPMQCDFFFLFAKGRCHTWWRFQRLFQDECGFCGLSWKWNEPGVLSSVFHLKFVGEGCRAKFKGTRRSKSSLPTAVEERLTG